MILPSTPTSQTPPWGTHHIPSTLQHPPLTLQPPSAATTFVIDVTIAVANTVASDVT